MRREMKKCRQAKIYKTQKLRHGNYYSQDSKCPMWSGVRNEQDKAGRGNYILNKWSINMKKREQKGESWVKIVFVCIWRTLSNFITLTQQTFWKTLVDVCSTRVCKYSLFPGDPFYEHHVLCHPLILKILSYGIYSTF